jgi:hypothetical protein
MPQAAQREGFVLEDEAPKVTPIKEPQQIEAKPAEPPAAPEQPEDDIFVVKWPMRIKLLHKPIRNNENVQINEVAFREPTGADINRYGSPIRMNPDGMFDIVDRNMSMMMAALSGINLPFLERMDPRDWNSCAYRLKLYFQPDTSGWL